MPPPPTAASPPTGSTPAGPKHCSTSKPIRASSFSQLLLLFPLFQRRLRYAAYKRSPAFALTALYPQRPPQESFDWRLLQVDWSGSTVLNLPCVVQHMPRLAADEVARAPALATPRSGLGDLTAP